MSTRFSRLHSDVSATAGPSWSGASAAAIHSKQLVAGEIYIPPMCSRLSRTSEECTFRRIGAHQSEASEILLVNVWLSGKRYPGEED
jgi:hypothetical protein